MAAAAELKFLDLDLDDSVVAAGGNITPTICVIPVGSGQSERVGRSVRLRSIHWKYYIILPSTTSVAATSDSVRCVLYVDLQCNGAAAAITDILASDEWQSWRNLNNSRRFHILYDKVHTLNSVSGAGQSATDNFGVDSISVEHHINTVNYQIEYSGTDGTLDELTSTNVGVLLVGRDGFAGFESKLRLRYYD